MNSRAYENFDLTIESHEGSYRAKAAGPAGEESSNVRLEITDDQLDSFLFKIGRPRYKTRRSSSNELEEAKKFGGLLYDSVFRDGVLSCLRSSISETVEKDLGLRLRLRLVGVPELNELPWEFLYMRTHNQFVSLSTYTPVVRYFELPEKIRPLQVSPPLKILVVISSPTDYPPLDTDREWNNVCTALRDLVELNLVELEKLEAPGLAQLDRYLTRNRVHILHFIGHGAFNNESQSGELVFQDAQGRGRHISAETIGTILNAHRSLRLVVLNACDGARANRTDPFAGTAQTLIQQGIPAVIGMQFEITDDAAIAFSGHFYSSVAIGEPIDRSLADARRTIYAEGNPIEWATPVLYLRAPDGRIFEVATTAEVEQRKAESNSVRDARDAAEAEQRREAETEQQRREAEAERQREIEAERQRQVVDAEAEQRRKTDAEQRRQEAERVVAIDEGNQPTSVTRRPRRSYRRQLATLAVACGTLVAILTYDRWWSIPTVLHLADSPALLATTSQTEQSPPAAVTPATAPPGQTATPPLSAAIPQAVAKPLQSSTPTTQTPVSGPPPCTTTSTSERRPEYGKYLVYIHYRSGVPLSAHFLDAATTCLGAAGFTVAKPTDESKNGTSDPTGGSSYVIYFVGGMDAKAAKEAADTAQGVVDILNGQLPDGGQRFVSRPASSVNAGRLGVWF